MKRFLTTIIAIILIVAMAAAIFVFVFDKKIPTKWASGPIAATKNDKFPNADNMPKNIKWSYEEITYTKDGNKTVKTYTNAGSYHIINKSTDEKEEYQVKCIKYDSKGDVADQWTIKYYVEGDPELKYKEEKGVKTVVADFDEVWLYALGIADFYANDRTLDTDIQIMIDSNLEYVTQKSLGITLHLVKDNESINITYSLTAKRIVRLEKIVDTYTDNVLSKRVHEVVEF